MIRIKDTIFTRISLVTFIVLSVVCFSYQVLADTVMGDKIGVGSNNYAIADTNYLQGGHMQVADRTALLAIKPQRRSTGMLVTVWDDDSGTAGNQTITYRLISNLAANCSTVKTDRSVDGLSSSSACSTTTIANWAVVLPLASDGYNSGTNKYLTADSSGNFVWGTVSGGGGGGGVTTVGTFSGSAQTDGASISGSTITFGPASATVPGMVSTGTQTFAGSKTFSSLPTFSSLTAGSLMFAGTSGIIAQDNSNLFWNASSTRLGIGTNDPQTRFNITGSDTSAKYQLVIEKDAPAGTYTTAQNTGNARVSIGVDGSYNPTIRLDRGITGGNLAAFLRQDWTWTSGGDYDFRFDMNNGPNEFYIRSTPGTTKHFIIGNGDETHVGIGGSPSSLFSVGSGGPFRVGSNGDLERINNVSYSWPGSQAAGAGYVLTNDGSGVLSWEPAGGGGGGLSSVSVTGSLSGDGTLLNPLSINQATSGSDGYLSSTDWSVFNNKLSSISTSGVVSGDGTMGNPLTLSLATNSSDGYLSSVDWGTFDSKLSSVSVFGVLSGDGTIGNPLTVNQSNSSTDGYLSATDWATFSNKQDFLTGSGVISVSFGSIGINQATSGSDGYLSSTDWSTFNGKQDLISVTTGGVVFGGSFGELITDTSLLFFDQNNSRLGVGTNSPSGLFSVGSSSQFMVDTNGDLTAVKGVTYSWPSSQAGGNGYVLSNDGSGVLSWSAPGAASMAVGSAVTSSTPGSILFADALSQLGEDNSNLFWDAINKNLGLMTASPQASLHIAGSPFLSSFQLAIERGAVAGTYGGANTGNARFLFGVDALNNPGIEIMRGETGFSQANSALYWDWSWSDGVDNDFRFYIEDANIFHIAGNTGTGSKLLKLDDVGLTVGQGVIFAGLNSTVGSGDALCIDPITNVVSRDSSGACAVSSQRFKHDITSLQLNALDTVNALHSVTFKYNGTDKIRTGFIAEEVEQVNKDYVVYEADGVTPHGVYYIDMIPLLAKSIQELDLKIGPITSLDTENPNSLGALVKQFLANTQNTILDLYAQIIHADRVETKQLCIGQTCVDENQLKQLLQQQSGGGSVSPNPPVVDDVPPPTDEIVVPSGDTEQVVEEVVPLDENPEPVAPIETIPQNDTPTPTE